MEKILQSKWHIILKRYKHIHLLKLTNRPSDVAYIEYKPVTSCDFIDVTNDVTYHVNDNINAFKN